MENEFIEEVQPTTAEIIAAKCSRMIDIEGELSRGDYKHSRQLRERQIGCALTLSDADYSAFCEHQKTLTIEYNTLESEVEQLKIQLETEVSEPII